MRKDYSEQATNEVDDVRVLPLRAVGWRRRGLCKARSDE